MSRFWAFRNNYPPGVTGNEPEIAGENDMGADDMVDGECCQRSRVMAKKANTDPSAMTLKGCMGAVAVVAAHEPTRYAINGVLVRRYKGKSIAVATDGRRMLIAEVADAGHLFEDAILPVGFLKKFVSKDKVVLMRGELATSGGPERFHGESDGMIRTTDVIEGKFPDHYLDQVPDSGDTRLRIGVDPKLLREMLQAVEKVAKKDKPVRPVIFEFTDGERPMKMTYENEDGVKLVGVLMPLKMRDTPNVRKRGC